MKKKPAPPKREPFPFTNGSSTTQDHDTEKNDTSANRMSVALYRQSDHLGRQHWCTVANAREAVDFLVDGLPSISGVQKLQPRTIEALRRRLLQAVDDMRMGLIADVVLCFKSAIGNTFLGFHRMPTEADRYTESVQLVKFCKHGHVHAKRFCPGLIWLAILASAFEEGASHGL